jgi:hypothetical protein
VLCTLNRVLPSFVRATDSLCKSYNTTVRSFSTVPIRDAKVGAFISLGLGIVCWFAFPVAHLFILGTGGLGLILGLILYWRHRNQTIA